MLAIGRAIMGAPRCSSSTSPAWASPPSSSKRFSPSSPASKPSTTILLVEQNASAALDVADRAYVLETGRIVLSGPAAQVAADPAVAAAYLGG